MAEQVHLARLPKGGDLVEEVQNLARRLGVTNAAVQVIGALERAELGFYRQNEQEYVAHPVELHCELLAGLGNISLKDGEPFAHLHLTLSFEGGSVTGGHAMPGCTIFAAEACIAEVPGPALERAFDPPTGLFLWKE